MQNFVSGRGRYVNRVISILLFQLFSSGHHPSILVNLCEIHVYFRSRFQLQCPVSLGVYKLESGLSKSVNLLAHSYTITSSLSFQPQAAWHFPGLSLSLRLFSTSKPRLSGIFRAWSFSYLFLYPPPGCLAFSGPGAFSTKLISLSHTKLLLYQY